MKRGALGELLRFEPAFVSEAKADSFWQMLMLHGALADGWRGDPATVDDVLAAEEWARAHARELAGAGVTS